MVINMNNTTPLTETPTMRGMRLASSSSLFAMGICEDSAGTLGVRDGVVVDVIAGTKSDGVVVDVIAGTKSDGVVVDVIACTKSDGVVVDVVGANLRVVVIVIGENSVEVVVLVFPVRKDTELKGTVFVCAMEDLEGVTVIPKEGVPVKITDEVK